MITVRNAGRRGGHAEDNRPVAIAHDIPVVTQDAGYDHMPDVEVIKILR
jgi:hypothetical protein